MTPERWESIKTIFDRALGLSPEEREGYLKEACKDDPGLYSEVQSLLEQFHNADGFLEQPLIEPAAALAPGSVIAGRYRIERLLGRGGMGEVYEARDELLKESVALKTLRAGLARNGIVLKRFQSEILLARKVTHPNVCRIFEVGVTEEAESGGQRLPFFVMELLNGESLAARIKRLGRLSKAQAYPIAAQIALGLAAAHKAGVVHRDLKSGNVMLTSRAGSEQAVITDFGLARIDDALEAPLSSTAPTRTKTMIAGTVGYMSPEQLTGGKITAASDIYSFGIVLFEMATGRLPFDERHLIRAAVQRASSDLTPLRKFAPDIDRRWEAAIMTCLQKEPKHRSLSAEQLAEVFGSGRWRAPRPVWRRAEWLKAAAFAALVVAGAAGVWAWTHRPYVPSQAADVWYQKGAASLRSLLYETARRSLAQAVEAEPRFALAHAALAEAYSELDYGERANREMLQAMSAAEQTHLSSADADRLRALRSTVSREFDRALQLYEQIESTATGSARPLAAIDTGFALEKKDDLAGAIAAYSRAEQLDPQNPAAKLHLGVLLGRQRKVDAALDKFSSAEALYSAASDYEGVTEVVFFRAALLNRSSRGAETIAAIEQALPTTETTGNAYQRVRLQLLEGAAYRAQGDTDKARALAETAVQTAVGSGMEGAAAVGLLDLGNAFQARGEPEPAENYFQQALTLAQRSEARQSEARAQLSLASVRLQYHRLPGVEPLLTAASAFYRQGGYTRESYQASLLLGRLHEQKAEFSQADQALRETVEDAVKLHDNSLAGQAHSELGSILELEGALPDALKEFETASKLLKANKLALAYNQANSGSIYWRLGREEDADRAFHAAEDLLKDLQGGQGQLRGQLLLNRAEMAYGSGHPAEALRWASQLARANGKDKEMDTEMGSSVRLLQGLSEIRAGQGAEGEQECDRALMTLGGGGQSYDLARSQLLVAEAMVLTNRKAKAALLAQSALDFFESRQIDEEAWQARWALAGSEPAEEQGNLDKARGELDRLRGQWQNGTFEGYLQEIEKSGISMAWYKSNSRLKK